MPTTNTSTTNAPHHCFRAIIPCVAYGQNNDKDILREVVLVKYISLSDLREWIAEWERQNITMSRFQELINEKVEERLKEKKND